MTHPTYDTYKDSDIPWLGDIPEHWEVRRLGDMFFINAGGDIKKENMSRNKDNKFKYPVYANSEKNKGLQGYSDIYKVDVPCITVTGRGTIGIPVARNEPFTPIVRLLVLIPKTREYNIFFFESAISLINFLVESTGVPQLTAPQVSTYKVAIPHLDEQQAIADFLDIETNKQKQKKMVGSLQNHNK